MNRLDLEVYRGPHSEVALKSKEEAQSSKTQMDIFEGIIALVSAPGLGDEAFKTEDKKLREAFDLKQFLAEQEKKNEILKARTINKLMAYEICKTHKDKEMILDYVKDNAEKIISSLKDLVLITEHLGKPSLWAMAFNCTQELLPQIIGDLSDFPELIEQAKESGLDPVFIFSMMKSLEDNINKKDENIEKFKKALGHLSQEQLAKLKEEFSDHKGLLQIISVIQSEFIERQEAQQRFDDIEPIYIGIKGPESGQTFQIKDLSGFLDIIHAENLRNQNENLRNQNENLGNQNLVPFLSANKLLLKDLIKEKNEAKTEEYIKGFKIALDSLSLEGLQKVKEEFSDDEFLSSILSDILEHKNVVIQTEKKDAETKAMMDNLLNPRFLSALEQNLSGRVELDINKMKPEIKEPNSLLSSYFEQFKVLINTLSDLIKKIESADEIIEMELNKANELKKNLEKAGDKFFMVASSQELPGAYTIFSSDCATALKEVRDPCLKSLGLGFLSIIKAIVGLVLAIPIGLPALVLGHKDWYKDKFFKDKSPKGQLLSLANQLDKDISKLKNEIKNSEMGRAACIR